MDHDDDVEHLFSWLQTPELRYREFAGAREITDTVVTWQPRPNTGEPSIEPGNNVQLAEEYPTDQFPDQTNAPVDIVVHGPVAPSEPVRPPEAVSRGPAMIAPMPPAEPPPPASHSGPFALGAAGRSTPQRPQVEEPLGQSPVFQTPAPRQAPVPPPHAPPAAPVPPPAAPAPGGGLLGGGYRENETKGGAASSGMPGPASPSGDNPPRSGRSLDAVFGRLSGGNRLPDPRDRLRHIPGLGPPTGRPR
jgi:hypothetical protein